MAWVAMEFFCYIFGSWRGRDERMKGKVRHNFNMHFSEWATGRKTRTIKQAWLGVRMVRIAWLRRRFAFSKNSDEESERAWVAMSC
jgi:hypothetical protein